MLLVELEDHHFDFVTNGEQLRGMADPPPGHVGNVQQAINTAQVNKRAILGDVLHHPLNDLPFGQRGKRLLLRTLPLFFQEHPA